MKKTVGMIKLYYIDCDDEICKGNIFIKFYDLKSFQEAVEFYNYLMEAEIPLNLNKYSEEIPEGWPSAIKDFELYICSEDGIDVTLGTNTDIWIANIYLK